MRNESFTLDPEAAGQAVPPFAAIYAVESIAKACWRILDAGGLEVGRAATRAGSRRAVLALYAQR